MKYTHEHAAHDLIETLTARGYERHHAIDGSATILIKRATATTPVRSFTVPNALHGESAAMLTTQIADAEGITLDEFHELLAARVALTKRAVEITRRAQAGEDVSGEDTGQEGVVYHNGVYDDAPVSKRASRAKAAKGGSVTPAEENAAAGLPVNASSPSSDAEGASKPKRSARKGKPATN